MDWLTISIVMAGFLTGFLAGASNQPTGGSLSSMIGGVFVGIFAGVSKAQVIDLEQISEIGKLFFLFQVTLLFTYIISNVLRKHDAFDFFLGD